MYCKFFGFSEKPFDITPDHRFLYMTPGHREALASILYGIRERRGFIALVGEAGTGKTTLLHAAIKRLDRGTKVAFIFNSDLPFLQVLALILDELRLLGSLKKLTKLEAFRRLNSYGIQQMAKGGNVVIMVDEAQNFDDRTIEGLRLLSNLESGKHKMIQVVLSGQPELDVKLNRQKMSQFVQRISLKRRTTSLSENDTYNYIRHRLKVAGYKGPDLFSKKAMQIIWQHSQGIPRRINVLCDNVLLNAYGMNNKRIQAIEVAEAINDLSFGHSNDIGGQRLRLSGDDSATLQKKFQDQR
jgi:general secretion pathway protein A